MPTVSKVPKYLHKKYVKVLEKKKKQQHKLQKKKARKKIRHLPTSNNAFKAEAYILPRPRKYMKAGKTLI